MAIGKEGNVKWVDGLRGLASAMVVLTHVTRAFDLQAFDSTSGGENHPPRFIQWPFVRVLTQGRIGVTIFAMVTGYVCALKPIRLCRQGNQEAAFKSMGKSALRRVPRLVMPATIATILVWIACQLGGFYVANHCDSWWMRETGPKTETNFIRSFRNLINNIIGTWTHGGNVYDANQWTLLPLLQGSMLVYVFMLATGYLRPKYRMMASMAMWLYYYLANEPTFGIQFFFGVFLSDVQNHPKANQFLIDYPRLCRLLSAVLIIWGLFVASYPEGHPDWVGWSKWQHHVLVNILPYNPDFSRFATGLGLQFIALGLHFSPYLRDVLSNRAFLWLGKQSFAVYLLHGPLLRSILAWMVFGFSTTPDSTDDEGKVVHHYTPFPGYTRLFLLLPIWIPINYAAALAWTTYVDPWCNRMTEKIVNYVLRTDEEKPAGTLPQ